VIDFTTLFGVIAARAEMCCSSGTLFEPALLTARAMSHHSCCILFSPKNLQHEKNANWTESISMKRNNKLQQ